MTKLQSWMMSGLAVVALGIGVLLASGAISSAQEGSDTPTPTPSEEATGDDSTATPEATEDATEPEDESGTDDGEDEDASGEEERSGCGGGKYAIKEAAAEILGLTEDEVHDALRDGQTLAALAEAQGMSVEDFRSALLEAVTADLQAKLDAGDITQEQFDEKVTQLNENIDDIINSEGGLRFRRSSDADGDGDGGVRFRAPFQQDPVGSGSKAPAPAAREGRGNSALSWPPRKTCLVIASESGPTRSCHSELAEWGRAVPVWRRGISTLAIQHIRRSGHSIVEDHPSTLRWYSNL